MNPTAPRTLPRAAAAAACTAALLVLPAAASAQVPGACPTQAASFPGADWPSRTEEYATSHGAAVMALDQYAFTLQGADEDRRGIRTDAVVIIHQGAVVYERYARGWNREQPHYTWSVSKSFSNALTGVAVARGALQITDSICQYVTAARQSNCNITVQNLLEFSSGLAWQEVYENQSNQASSVLAMLYGEGRRDVVAFVTGHPSRDAPGTTYQYSTGDATLLAAVADRAMRARARDEGWPWAELFDPIGMGSAVFERDGQGAVMGGSWFYATPRDLARFGFFLQNDGCWDGRRILPAGWVHDSTVISDPFRRRRLETSPGDEQGRQFWLNLLVPELGITTRPWPDVPEDAFAARGHWGQSITVIPSLDLVVVRTADDRETGILDFNRFLRLAIAVVQ